MKRWLNKQKEVLKRHAHTQKRTLLTMIPTQIIKDKCRQALGLALIL